MGLYKKYILKIIFNFIIIYFLILVVCEDITSLTKNGLIPEGIYDLVIDKGCLDCLFSNPNNTSCDENVLNSLKEINKIITNRSSYYLFSTCKPDKLIGQLTSVFNTKIEIEEISKNKLKNKLKLTIIFIIYNLHF